jgi:hypothetical protein
MFPAVSRSYLSQKLTRPLPTKDGGTLRTLLEALLVGAVRPANDVRSPQKGGDASQGAATGPVVHERIGTNPPGSKAPDRPDFHPGLGF